MSLKMIPDLNVSSRKILPMNTYKILFVGEGGVGKTSFLHACQDKPFDGKYIPTLGVEVEPLSLSDHILNIWDCAGSEKFRGLGDGYYVRSQGVIFFFDLTSLFTLTNLGKWVQDCLRLNGNIPFVIVGTKSDMKEAVSDEDVKKVLGDYPYIRTSSKTKENVKHAISVLLEQL